MEELEGIESLAAAIGSPLLESLNKEARLGCRARADLLGRYNDACAEVRRTFAGALQLQDILITMPNRATMKRRKESLHIRAQVLAECSCLA